MTGGCAGPSPLTPSVGRAGGIDDGMGGKRGQVHRQVHPIQLRTGRPMRVATPLINGICSGRTVNARDHRPSSEITFSSYFDLKKSEG